MIMMMMRMMMMFMTVMVVAMMMMMIIMMFMTMMMMMMMMVRTTMILSMVIVKMRMQTVVGLYLCVCLRHTTPTAPPMCSACSYRSQSSRLKQAQFRMERVRDRLASASTLALSALLQA